MLTIIIKSHRVKLRLQVWLEKLLRGYLESVHLSHEPQRHVGDLPRVLLAVGVGQAAGHQVAVTHYLHLVHVEHVDSVVEDVVQIIEKLLKRLKLRN